MSINSLLLALCILSACYAPSNANGPGCPFSKRAKERSDYNSLTLKEDPDPETTTTSGCKCVSICGATINGDYYAYDWCYTEDNCGEYNIITGWWDKCLYLDSSKLDYVAQGWEEKHSQMWANVLEDDSLAPSPISARISRVLNIFTDSMKTTFDNEWDKMPVGRIKSIHANGAVCPFLIDIKDSPFTGLFSDGQTHGMIRLGSTTYINEKSGVTPGAGVKFFRTGRSSGNVVLLNQLAPIADSNYNFFSVPLLNLIPEEMPASFKTKSKLILTKFCQAQDCPTKVGLSDLCKYDQEGNEAENIVFPFKVTLMPTGSVNFREEPSSNDEFYQQFDGIETGTAIYELRGHQSPDDAEGWVIGNVVTTDKCVTSLYGDTKMFFKHQYIAEDKALRPEWTEAYDSGCTSAC